ncbi:hypothetical protein [Polyangium sp. y55x31]|uniref:hypothetical protein n=1 Tax=Polyangium sp. y55x31 TaxID=3042688 RepID=UPI00248216B5|nr:hypothetical protein [Polyangium sp. y55x31]MDI1477935.1 hypothetical protein [Polyangium sp. y55x31]
MRASLPLCLAALLVAPLAEAEGGVEPVPLLPGVCPPMLGPLDLGVNRNPSGTAWEPDTTPMFGTRTQVDCWDLIQQQNVFTGYDLALGPRGGRGFTSMNWQTFLARRRFDGAEVKIRWTWSLEALGLTAEGSPSLLQIPNRDVRAPVVDRQLPQEAFMELSLLVTAPLGEDLALQIYVAPAGEPALGPPSYTRRFSAFADPFAPLGHSMQDAAHVTHGVLTLGLLMRRWKVEASWFNGRPHDDDPLDFDLAPPDAYAARFTLNPLRFLSLQASGAWLRNPDRRMPGVSITRATASAFVGVPLGDPAAGSHLGASAIFGQNAPSEGPTTRSGLVEATLLLSDRHEIFARAEILQRSGRELLLPAPLDSRVFPIRSLALGYVHSFPLGPIRPGLGLRFDATDVVTDELARRYGDRVPLGGMIFLRLRPPVMELPHTPM